MEIRLCFRGEIYIEGTDLTDCMRNFQNMDSDEFRKNFDFVEIDSVEDAETYDDLTSAAMMCNIATLED